MILIELLASPEKTLTNPDIDRRLNPIVAVAGLLLMTAVDFVMMFRIGNVEGGNPCLWFIIGGMLDLDFVQSLSHTGRWLLLYPVKIAGDLAIIFLSAWIGIRFFSADRKLLRRWFCVYSYTLTAIDVFLVCSMAPAVLLGGGGRALMVTNLLSYGVFAANAVVFTNAYRCCFSLRFDQAYYGWFVPVIAVPFAILAPVFLILK